jgi:multicomponent Na+:H+ antiporter subunit E
MAALLVAFVFSMLFYLALTAGSGGDLLFWSTGEVAAGAAFSVLTALLAWKLLRGLGARTSWGFLNPVRWLTFVAYAVGPFFLSMAKANLDVACRVVTGRIRPGIVKVPTGLTNDLALSLLANSITLTPGTLSVDVDERNNLYVHCIHLGSKDPKPEEVYGSFAKWARRIAE